MLEETQAQVKPSERLRCPFQEDNLYVQKDALKRIRMWKNLEHSLMVDQLPSVELHGDVAAQACLHPLMTIPQMVTCDKQTVPLEEDGHVPMEPREDAQCVNKGSVQHDRQRMLQVGEEIQEGKEQENEQGSSKRRSGILGWWEVLYTWLPSIGT